jgi:CRP-like cAMP-binding protein
VLPGIEKDNVDFLSLLSEANRHRVLESSTKTDYSPGAIAYHPEMPPRAFLLDHGLVRAYVSVPDGRQATCTFFHARELIGGTSIVSHPPAIVVQVVVNSALTCLDLVKVRKLASMENEVTTAVAVHLAALVRSSFRLEVGRLECRATHAELADSIGSAREVVGRTLGRLRDEGIVETAPGLVRVVDPLRLAGIVRAFTV